MTTDTREAIKALVAKWRAIARGDMRDGDTFAANRVEACADAVEALLADNVVTAPAYDRELIARMLASGLQPFGFSDAAINEQIEALRAADNAAAAVVPPVAQPAGIRDFSALARQIDQHIRWREQGVSRVPSIGEMREWANAFVALTTAGAAQGGGEAVYQWRDDRNAWNDMSEADYLTVHRVGELVLGYETVITPSLTRQLLTPASPAVGMWRPIESAPRDGTSVLLTNGIEIHEGEWFVDEGGTTEFRDADGNWVDQDDREGCEGWMDWSGGMTPAPTHWCPLHAITTPTPAAQGGGEADYGHGYRDGYTDAIEAASTGSNTLVAWRDMATAPRDGTLLRLLVEFTDHSTEDSERAPTIGNNNFDNDDEDVWQFAGWCWSHDHFTAGKGTPVGWLPLLHDASAPTLSVQRGGDVVGMAIIDALTKAGVPHYVDENGNIAITTPTPAAQPSDAVQLLISALSGEHGGDHHDDDCDVCAAIKSLTSSTPAAVGGDAEPFYTAEEVEECFEQLLVRGPRLIPAEIIENMRAVLRAAIAAEHGDAR